VTGDLDLATPASNEDVVAQGRRLFPGVLIVAGGYDFESGTAAIENKRGNLIAVARPFVANPDLIAMAKVAAASAAQP
jgi:N-ethylmaleimide reductase